MAVKCKVEVRKAITLGRRTGGRRRERGGESIVNLYYVKGRDIWYVKGAIETVLPRCSSFYNNAVTQLEGTPFFILVGLFIELLSDSTKMKITNQYWMLAIRCTVLLCEWWHVLMGKMLTILHSLASPVLWTLQGGKTKEW